MRIRREPLLSGLASGLLLSGSGNRRLCAAQYGSAHGTGAAGPPSLRPHATMLDLLCCMVMLFAFQMGQPLEVEAEAVAIQSSTTGAPANDEREFLLLRPRFEQGRWRYREDRGGRTLAPEEVFARAREGNVVPVFMLDGGTSLQRYLDAEAPLRERGLTVEVVVMSQENQQ